MRYLLPKSTFTESFNRSAKAFFSMMVFCVLFMLISSSSAFAQDIMYVDADAEISGVGVSWNTAYNNLQDALYIAGPGDQIWVAEGTYYPNEGETVIDTGRGATFQLLSGVEIYGGFEGNENNLSERDWQANETILSGDIDGDNTSSNNSYHVVNGTGVDDTAVLDGFTVTGGNADGDDPYHQGGGIFIYNSLQSGSPTLSHLRITENEARHIGGGIFSYNSSFTLFNVEISENAADYGGGGMYITVGHPKLLNVDIHSNSADRGDGGGINSATTDITLTNVSIQNNSANGDGGGFYNTGNPDIQNSILWGNTAGNDGDQVYTNTLYGAVPTYTNSLVEDNDLTGTGTGNLDGTAYTTELIFDDFAGGDYSLAPGSDAINAGGNVVYENAGGDLQNDNDLAGYPRLDAAIVDLGAYEYQGASTPPAPDGGTLYVDKDVSGGDGSGDSWGNAIPELADALKWAYQLHQVGTPWSESNPLEIWVAEGTYSPDEGDRATDNDRNETFQLISGVKVYGGFEGDEDDLTDRDWEEHLTVLSGDIDGDDASDGDGVVTDPDHISGDNSYSVVTGSDADETAILDGFTITGGSADDGSAGVDEPERNGGGIYNYEGSPTLTNLVIIGNITEYRGGGVYNYNSSPVLTNVTIRENRTVSGSSSAHHGGGIANISGSSAVLMNSKIVENRAQAGGGMYNDESSPTLINTLIADNTAASSNGGGIYSFYSTSTELINVTVSGNHAGYQGGGIFNAYNTLDLKNTIVWGNTADGGNEIATQFGDVNLENSLYGNDTGDIIGEGSFNTTLTLKDDPQFTDASNGDYTLEAFSPALDAGNDAFARDIEGNPLTIDQNGEPRIVRTVDMGAYEFQGEPVTAPDPVVLSAPADEATNTGLTPEFSWQAVDGADEYQLQVSGSDDEFSSTVIDESVLTETNFEPIDDLDNLTTYYWRVRASNGVGEGEWSEVFSFTTLPESSEVVILTDPSDDFENAPLKPLFEWNPADGADSYDLVVSPNGDLSDPVIEEDGIDDTEFQTASNLDFSTTYHWRVRGVNSGGSGPWSEVFSFTTQDQPEAADNRILLANTESYTFTPTDFGTADNNFSILIDDLPGGFNGTMELDGNPVSTDDEISVGNIDDGDLIYTPPADVYGYGLESFGFSLKDASGNVSEESYTMSLDVAATSVDLDYEGEGWRFLSSPTDGETIGDFFGQIWTQGFTGSNSPGADFANIQSLNQQEYVWEPVENDQTELNVGDAVIAYVYGDDDNNGSDDGFPKTLSSSTDNWIALDGSYEESFSYDPDQQDSYYSFYLWGNPHPVAIDLCEADLNNIPKNAYFWDPAANGGNGGYVNLSCDSDDDVHIAPYQAVWLRITDANNSMKLPSGTYLGGATDGYFKETKSSSDNFIVSLTVRSEGQLERSFTNTTRILFDDDASVGSDLIDAPKLSSAGLVRNYLSLYSLDEQTNPYALQALPMAIEEKTHIPLDIQTTESGQFTLDWTLPESHVFSGSYFLRDNKTGEVIELKDGSEYSFEIDEAQTSKDSESLEVSGEATHPMSEIAGASVKAVNTHRMNSGETPRFELLIATSGVDGLTELGAVPDDYTLAQNYPNPFNPTTVISYQLPVNSDVRLDVYDMLGRNVATLVDGQVSAGRHTVNFDASNLSSGVYLYRLQAGAQIMTKKLTILK